MPITLSRTEASRARELARHRRKAIAEITELVRPVRLQFITDLPGQDMIYMEKEREALRYLAEDPQPSSLDDFPWIEQEVGSTASTAYEVAQVFANLAARWRTVGARLEGLRIDATTQVDSATSKDEVDAAVSDLKELLEILA